MKTEIHQNISKDDAYKLMEQGHRITHQYFADNEYLVMSNGIIYDELGYPLGTKYDDFWAKRQKWQTGWSTTNGKY
jgi:hypothetical protein